MGTWAPYKNRHLLMRLDLHLKAADAFVRWFPCSDDTAPNPDFPHRATEVVSFRVVASETEYTLSQCKRKISVLHRRRGAGGGFCQDD